MNRLIGFTAGLILVTLIGNLLIEGRGILIPLVVAIFIWHLLNSIHHSVQKIPLVGAKLPNWLGLLASFALVGVFFRVLFYILSNNIVDVIDAVPKYQEHFLAIMGHLDDKYHYKTFFDVGKTISSINVQNVVVNIYGVFSTIASSTVLITLYVVFLFVEQLYFEKKLDVIFRQEEHRKLIKNIMFHITKDTQTYLGIKTLLSVVTALASFVIMKWVNLDFAEFWALLIFFLNYIPNIGAMLATAFPMILALVQFSSWWPFIEITVGIVLIQFVVGNFLEPKLLGKSLNLSTLVIMISLALWGSIWGILGMFLSIPITVMMMIIFGHFKATRPIAILLSQNGQVDKSYEAL